MSANGFEWSLVSSITPTERSAEEGSVLPTLEQFFETQNKLLNTPNTEPPVIEFPEDPVNNQGVDPGAQVLRILRDDFGVPQVTETVDGQKIITQGHSAIYQNKASVDFGLGLSIKQTVSRDYQAVYTINGEEKEGEFLTGRFEDLPSFARSIRAGMLPTNHTNEYGQKLYLAMYPITDGSGNIIDISFVPITKEAADTFVKEYDCIMSKQVERPVYSPQYLNTQAVDNYRKGLRNKESGVSNADFISQNFPSVSTRVSDFSLLEGHLSKALDINQYSFWNDRSPALIRVGDLVCSVQALEVALDSQEVHGNFIELTVPVFENAMTESRETPVGIRSLPDLTRPYTLVGFHKIKMRKDQTDQLVVDISKAKELIKEGAERHYSALKRKSKNRVTTILESSN